MFVPSLSWQNVRFYVQMAAKTDRFDIPLRIGRLPIEGRVQGGWLREVDCCVEEVALERRAFAVFKLRPAAAEVGAGVRPGPPASRCVAWRQHSTLATGQLLRGLAREV